MSVFDIFAKLEAEKAAKQTHSTPNSGIAWLIVGLGNPTKKYDGTRHNVGFRTLDLYSKQAGVAIDKMKFKALIGEGMLAGERVLFMKPQTYMNLSGEAVRDAATFYKIPPERVLVIYDDITQNVGTLRIRAKGSAGGQNGMKNIILHLGSDNFPRIRVGIGDKPHPDYDLADWVLSSFSSTEMPLLEQACKQAMRAAEEIIANGVPSASNKYNGAVKM